MVAEPAELRQLERAVVIARELATRRIHDPPRYLRWLPLQAAFLLSVERFRLLRAGNQGLGKTTAALAEVVGRCLGRHPLGVAVSPPPVEWWVICASKDQSVAIQKKLHALLPPDEIAWGRGATVYHPSRGFVPRGAPIVQFKNGSVIRFKATAQDSLDLSGATIDGALFDEPPSSERIFTEVLQRVEERGGFVLLSFTPVNADVSYLRELVGRGVLTDFHSRLTPEALIPVGCSAPLRTADGRPKDAEWIAAKEGRVSAYEREVVVHGGWEFRTAGAWFSGAWDPSRLVFEATISRTDRIILGIDHGDRPGKQVAVLMAVDDRAEDPIIHVVDVYRDAVGLASPADDARGILAMLGRHGIPWSRLSFAGGDRVHLPGSAKQKSNKDLQAQVRKRLAQLGQLQPDGTMAPAITTVKRGPGRGAESVRVGSRWLFHRMVAGQFSVSPAAAFLLEALPKYTLDDDDCGHKDVVDAIRYGLDRYIFGWHRSAAPSPS
ncbi:MAG: terminase family protein [Myxococcota bacterium]